MTTKTQLEFALYDHNKLGWSAYTYMRYLGEADQADKAMIRTVWDSLDPDIQDRIRVIRKIDDVKPLETKGEKK